MNISSNRFNLVIPPQSSCIKCSDSNNYRRYNLYNDDCYSCNIELEDVSFFAEEDMVGFVREQKPKRRSSIAKLIHSIECFQFLKLLVPSK